MNELLAQLTQVAGLAENSVWIAALVFLRVGAAVALMPAFGEQSVPQRIKLAIALAFTAVVFPAVSERMQNLPSFPIAAAEEVLAGLALGIGMRLFILALQFAGAIAAQTSSLSQLFGGATPEPQPAVSNLLTVAALAIAVSAGLHVRAAKMLILSYQAFPAGHFPRIADIADWGLANVVRATALGFTLAAPFVIASVIYNLALGIINRAMPQMPVSLVGAPLLTLGSLVIMAIMAPLMLGVWLEGFTAFLADPTRVAP